MRLIDADALIPLIKMGECNMYDEYCQGRNGGLEFAVNQVKQMPTIEPERMKGEWIYTPTEPLGYVCSVCGKGSCRYNYCPNCGADMRGEGGCT